MKKIIQTDSAPQAIGPYSQAVASSGFLFCSGQIPLDPKTGKIVGEGDVQKQTSQVMVNLGEVLKAGGASFESVIRATLYIKNMDDFPKINEIYGSYFQENPPARACVEVARLPKDVLVEIDAIAMVS